MYGEALREWSRGVRVLVVSAFLLALGSFVIIAEHEPRSSRGEEQPSQLECVREDGAPNTASEDAKQQQLAKLIPWWSELHGYCIRYHESVLEGEKSEIFNQYNACVERLGKITLKDIPAKIKRIDAPQGGNAAQVWFEIEGAFDISTHYDTRSPAWPTVSTLREGALVLISATDVAPLWGIPEESHVCPAVYSGKVWKIVPERTMK